MSDCRATLQWNLTKLPKMLMEALPCLWKKLNNDSHGPWTLPASPFAV